MSDEIRAAAEAVADTDFGDARNFVTVPRSRMDALRAALARHADDGEPVTKEWWDQLLGFRQRKFGDHFGLYLTPNGEVELFNSAHIHILPCKTRGDVRRLLAALGVDIKPV